MKCLTRNRTQDGNVHAAYLLSFRNPHSAATGLPRNYSDYLDTEWTVGRFWVSQIGGGSKCGGDGDDDDGACAASISKRVWSTEAVQRNRAPSPHPPAIMLRPLPPGRRRCLRSLDSGEAEGETASSQGRLSMGPEENDLEEPHNVQCRCLPNRTAGFGFDDNDRRWHSTKRISRRGIRGP